MEQKRFKYQKMQALRALKKYQNLFIISNTLHFENSK